MGLLNDIYESRKNNSLGSVLELIVERTRNPLEVVNLDWSKITPNKADYSDFIYSVEENKRRIYVHKNRNGRHDCYFSYKYFIANVENILGVEDKIGIT